MYRLANRLTAMLAQIGLLNRKPLRILADLGGFHQGLALSFTVRLMKPTPHHMDIVLGTDCVTFTWHVLLVRKWATHGHGRSERRAHCFEVWTSLCDGVEPIFSDTNRWMAHDRIMPMDFPDIAVSLKNSLPGIKKKVREALDLGRRRRLEIEVLPEYHHQTSPLPGQLVLVKLGRPETKGRRRPVLEVRPDDRP